MLSTPGVHNVVNALAAMAVGMELDIDFRDDAGGPGSSSPASIRRLELKWNDGIKLIDDYGHHPTEIRATLSAIRSMWNGRIIVAFQPHRYTRTKALLDEFVTSFNEADVLMVTEIYAASEETDRRRLREPPRREDTVGGPQERGIRTTKEEVVRLVSELVKPGDMVVTLGAGDIYKVGEELAGIWRRGS